MTRMTPEAEREWPAVSVVMPVLNEERHLEAAVRRVQLQDYPGPLEVLLVVGPGSDRSEQIAADSEQSLPVGSLDKVEASLRSSPRFRVAYDTGDAVVFVLSEPEADR